ncbi:MAG TPA: chemotaxis protein CheW, partial [Planctomycetota bacterium]|nr:chemotaxis protein CheW [Planctomycetota bacterium]
AEAGGARLVFDLDVVEAVGVPGAVLAVPGGEPWLRGLTVWRGRFRTLVDAGLLFGSRPAAGAGLIVLKELGIDTALIVDELPRRLPEGEKADRELDLATLKRHPAFQPGAAMKRTA